MPNEVTSADRQRFARARKRGCRDSRRLVAVVNARYDAARHVVELVFRSGKVVAIPRALLPGLERARVSTLKAVSVSPACDVISWRARDVDLSVRGLLKRAKASRASMRRRESRISPRLAKRQRYTLERKAEFLLNNAGTDAEYRVARREAKALGLDPDVIPHVRPTSR